MKKLHEIHLTDSGNARLIAALHGDRLRFDHRRGRWLLFQPGLWWQGNLNAQVERIAAKIPSERIRLATDIEDQEARGKAVRWGLNSESKARRDAMLELAKFELPISDSGEGWDAEPMLLAVANWSGDKVSSTVVLPDALRRFGHCADMENGEVFDCAKTLGAAIPAHDFRVFRFQERKGR